MLSIVPMLYVAVVSGLTVKSLIHFDLIFIYGKRGPIRFLILHSVRLATAWASKWLSGKRICLKCRRCWEDQVQTLDWEDPLGKEMTTLSIILVWKISWTEEPSRLQSMGFQRVGHDWVTKQEYTFIPHLQKCLLNLCSMSFLLSSHPSFLLFSHPCFLPCHFLTDDFMSEGHNADMFNLPGLTKSIERFSKVSCPRIPEMILMWSYHTIFSSTLGPNSLISYEGI